ncbi:MAG: GNAT family N-acetyltransferase [Candidatus Margulisbacteria bacterium]|jgi:GNAT superfamily N-acetyltransferase|nr:GNAT family N-acetyltransferase [Candidatus Margulisiibacteriota bacterium]
MTVEIVDFQTEYQPAFKALNEEWIAAYFELEPEDYPALNDPQGHILAKGGKILVAILDGAPVGVCALIKLSGSPYDYELAKMAVAPRAQGQGVGYLLGRAALRKARELDARGVYLTTNSALRSAVRLYQKLGFKTIPGASPHYKRGDVQMALVF